MNRFHSDPIVVKPPVTPLLQFPRLRTPQTLHDKVVNTVVVKAHGSDKIVEKGGLGALPAGYSPPPAYAPPINLGSVASQVGIQHTESIEDKLRALDDLKAKGLVTEAEYEERRKAILQRF